MSRTRAAIAAAGILVICGAPFAGAATRDPLREGVRNGTTRAETEIIGQIGAATGSKGGYVTRQSNLSSTGGGAIYGCRASSASTSEACIRANNLRTGHAFEFESGGPVVGTFQADGGGDTKKPFTTNATGIATGLNADRLDSLHAAEIIALARTKAGLTAADSDALGGTSADAIKNETTPFSFRLTTGQTKVIATQGPLTMSATCTIASGGSDIAKVAITTSVDNAFGDGGDVGNVADVDTGGEVSDTLTIATTTPSVAEGEVFLVAPDGSTLASGEDTLMAVNVHGIAAACYFAGYVVRTAATT